MNEIININDLKTDYWKSKHDKQRPKLDLDYDSGVDTLYMYFVPINSKDRIITHYLDQYVSFLFRSTDNEIVGMSFENFMKGFLPKYAKNPWKLSATGVQLNGIKEFVFRVIARDMPQADKFFTMPGPIEKKVQAETVFA